MMYSLKTFLFVVSAIVILGICDTKDILAGGLPPLSYDEVPHADYYAQIVPSAGADGLKGKKIGFLIDDMVEDIEAAFPLAWAYEGGATVEIICADNTMFATVADFTRPTMNIICDKTASTTDWESFDLVMIPGGAGIFYIRNQPKIIEGVKAALATKKTVIAVICAGNEIGIDLDLKENYGIDTLAGPDSSVADIIAAGYKHSPDMVIQPNKDVPYIMGHDPHAHTDWIMHVCTALGVQCTAGTKTGYDLFDDMIAKYDLPHRKIESLYDIPRPYAKPAPINTTTPLYPDNILVIVSRSSQWPELETVAKYFSTAVITVACAWKLGDTPNGRFDGMQELSNSMYPETYIKCDMTLDEVHHAARYDMTVIPSGPWAATVLRGNPAVEDIIRSSRYVITFGESNEIALNATLGSKCMGSYRAYGPVYTYMKTKKYTNGDIPILMTEDDGHGRSVVTCDTQSQTQQVHHSTIITAPSWEDDTNAPTNAVVGYLIAIGALTDYDKAQDEDDKFIMYFMIGICILNVIGLMAAIYLMACRKPNRRYTRV